MDNITDKDFTAISEYVKKTFGIKLTAEKKTLVHSRLQTVVEEGGFNSIASYFEHMKRDKTGEAAITFIDKITTNHTFFMREVDHFYYFRDNVLPFIKSEFGKEKDVRLWCSGCSSGEESYTLQMFIEDYFGKEGGWNQEMLATDISTKVLNNAIKGVYSTESIKALPPDWQKNYFQKHDAERSIVADSIKKNITYRRLNLMEKSFPFKKKFQVIFCRNVMIYFDTVDRDALVDKYYDLLEDGGYLFIGHAESLNQRTTRFSYVKPAVYRKEK